MTERVVIISSDGHASAKMAEYRPYIPPSFLDEFDRFCQAYEEHGIRSSDPEALQLHLNRIDLDNWVENMVRRDRLAGFSDPGRRLQIMDDEGVTAEVLFPDFGLPFQFGGPVLEYKLGHSRTLEQQAAADQAYNRWLADYCRTAPDRLFGMASVTFDDVDAACDEIRRAREAGLKGVVLPAFDEARPLYSPDFDAIWSLLEELEMPANSHAAISSITRRPVPFPMPHPATAVPLSMPFIFFHCHQILNHLIWGGVLDRHPRLKVVFTEQGSGWLPATVAALDHSWGGSYLRTDIREVVPNRPSEYYERQCFVGASLFSKAEMEAREQIGVDKIMLGMDYPHHEGTFPGAGTAEYLRATLGSARVPAEDARLMLYGNAVRVWGFDLAVLQPVADRFGPDLSFLLAEPEVDRFPRGDVHKPLNVTV